MIAQFPWQFLVALHALGAFGTRDPTHLRGAGLARHAHAGLLDRCALCGPHAAVDDRHHPLANHLQVFGIDVQRPKTELLTGSLARRHRWPAGQARLDRPHAIRDARRHHGELERRRQDIALTDAADHGLALRPRLLECARLPRPCWHQSAPLGRQVDPELDAETEPVCHLADRINAGAARNLVKIDIA